MSLHSEVRDCLMVFGPHLFLLTPTVKLDDKTHVRGDNLLPQHSVRCSINEGNTHARFLN